MELCSNSDTDAPRVDESLVIPVISVHHDCVKEQREMNYTNETGHFMGALRELTDVSFIDGDVERLADVLTLWGRGKHPCLGPHQLSLPRWQPYTVHLQEEDVQQLVYIGKYTGRVHGVLVNRQRS